MKWALSTATLIPLWIATGWAYAQGASPDVKDWQLTDSGVRLTIDLDQLRARVKQEVPAVARDKAPLHDFQWFNFKFSALHVQVDNVDVQTLPIGSEAAIGITGGIEAKRERLEFSFDRGFHWDPNGGKRVVQLTVAARLRVAVAGPTEVSFTLLGDSIRGESQLHPIHGATLAQALGGAPVFEQRLALDKLVPTELLEGVHVTGIRFAQIGSSTVTVDLDLEVQ